MKTLYLVRHAKSSWKYPQLDDFERPLNKRGRKNAPLIGRILKKRGVLPDLVLSSPANRTTMTARIIAGKIGFALEKIVYTETIYYASTHIIIKLIKQVDNKVDKLMIVGHNPAITNLANKLGDNPVSNVPTSAIYCIHLDISAWKKIQTQSGKTRFFEYPKKYLS
jgi:phosphohistidine phosphatase